MEESNKYGHQHPLRLLKEEHLISNQNGARADCSRCGEEVSSPVYGCAECGFYLHKVCAGAPMELDHPFHRRHPLVLMQKKSYHGSPTASYLCGFCGKHGTKFAYQCSCDLRFHIKCALFTYNIAQNNSKKLEHVALVDPSTSTKTDDKKDVTKCHACLEPLAKYTYFSPDCGFSLHKKCVELPLRIHHKCHRRHPLFLQFNNERFMCNICRIRLKGAFVYGCSTCSFFFHIECLSQPHTIEDKSHQHPFTLFWRQIPFICDACGTYGKHVAYTCGTCGIIVHKKCISLPPFIKSKWHDHRLSHTYFRHREDGGILDCVICHKKVNAEHGSYSCSKCNGIFHVNCVTKDERSYVIVENEDEEPLDISVDSIIVLEWNDAREAILVQHFKHIHSLRLSDKVSEYDHKCCEGCFLPISTSFYYCSQCDFYLHKACAELPKIKSVWHHHCQRPLVLTSSELFECERCEHSSNSFAYKCEECGSYTCLRCVLALTPGARTCEGHKHPLFFYIDRGGDCTACGEEFGWMFHCKDCNISLDNMCFSLPITARHKCDAHLLSLTDHDDTNYSESYFCDICEGSRNPNRWFYHCARCDTFAHVKCVLGDYPFIKLGSAVEIEDHNIPEHPLTFVRRTYCYPNCSECGKPCLDFAIECSKSECNYICHASCP